MALKKYRPKTPGSRYKTTLKYEELTKKPSEKRLTKSKSSSGGRNNNGRMTSRRRGGGHKRKYRIIDFKRNKFDISAKVVAIEYDPNRSANIALLVYEDGEKRYILAPDNLKINDKIMTSENAPIKTGNSLKLKNIPSGYTVHNIEMKPGKGAQIARGAGAGAKILASEGKYVSLKMPSGEVRKILEECFATLGKIGNSDFNNVIQGKAGRNRWRGKRPKVRGVAMNPVDHPMGGGEGRSSGGGHPRTPWGKITKGLKTRKKKNSSNKHIVSRRKKKNKRG